MENPFSFEDEEEVVGRLIENFAKNEGVTADDMLSDIITFWEISQEDKDAEVYFEALAEEINVSVEKILRYAKKKSEEK